MANQAKEGEIRWRKVSGKMTLRDKTIVKPGDVFLARPEDIPKVFMDTIVPVNPDDLPGPEAEPAVEVVRPEYSIKSIGPGKYNVVDGQGKAVNEKPLTKVDAEKLMENLG